MARSFHEWLFIDVDWKISSGDMKGQRYTFDAFPCVIDIIRDDHHAISVMKSAQMALSETFTLQRPFYHMDVHGRNWAILFPTQTDMRNFFKTRVKGAIKENPYIRRQTTAENQTNTDVFNRSLYMRYTTSEGAIATFDAAGITIDEQDIHNPDTLYGVKTSRTQGSMGDTFWYEISTPTYPNVGIDISFLNSDQRIWLIKCEHCGKDNDLTMKIGEYDASDTDKFFQDFLGRIEDWRDYYFPCSHCAGKLDPVKPLDPAKPSFGGGRWVARYPKRDSHGYHIQIFQRLYDGGTPKVLHRVRNNLMAAHKPTHVRRWWNFTIGVPHSPVGGRLTDEEIEIATQYTHPNVITGPYRNVRRLEGIHPDWMGVDVRDGQYHVFGMTRDSLGKRICLAGWVETSGEVKHLWDFLGRPVLMQDADPDVNDTRSLIGAMGRRARRGRFSGSLKALYTESAAEKDLVMINRAGVMEEIQSAIRSGEWVVPRELWATGSGCFKKIGKETHEETLKDHFKAPTMVEVENDVTGNIDYDFPKNAMRGTDPHFFMAACLAHIASEIKAAPASLIIIPR